MKILAKRIVSGEKRAEGYTDRQQRIDGWRQDLIRAGRVLVLGSGALGNEIIKNLVLMGIGYVLLADFDRVEPSNLSRAVLLRRHDMRGHHFKAEAVAKRARALSVNPDICIQPFTGDIVWRMGTGVYRRVDVVLGCLDNVEARIAANRACVLTGTPYIDGAIGGLGGNVVAVNPPVTPCWECSVPPDLLELRRERYASCWHVMDLEFRAGLVPTVQVASSIIAGFQTQEAVKIVQRLRWAAGTKTIYSALGARPVLDNVTITRREDCWCNMVPPSLHPLELPLSARGNTLADLTSALKKQGDFTNPRVILPGPFALELRCSKCSAITSILKPSFELTTQALICPRCRAGADFTKLIEVEEIGPGSSGVDMNSSTSSLLDSMSLYDLGFASLAWAAFVPDPGAARPMYAELSADVAEVMGESAFRNVRNPETGLEK